PGPDERSQSLAPWTGSVVRGRPASKIRCCGGVEIGSVRPIARALHFGNSGIGEPGHSIHCDLAGIGYGRIQSGFEVADAYLGRRGSVREGTDPRTRELGYEGGEKTRHQERQAHWAPAADIQPR